MARSKLTDETLEKVTQALRAGNYRKAACRFAGIGETTMYRWLEQGEADIENERESMHRAFWEAVNRAEAQAEVEAVAMIRKAMPEDWRAAAHYLERRYPEMWGRKDSRQEALLAEIADDLRQSTAREITSVMRRFAEEMGLDPSDEAVRAAGAAALREAEGLRK